MTRGKKLALLSGILVMLLIATLIVTKHSAESEDTAENYESVLSINVNSVTQLSWTCGGESISVTKTDTGWSCDNDEALPVDSDVVSTLLSAVAEVYSYKTISEPAELREYGLEEAQCVINITADAEYELRLGDVSELSGELYLYLGDGAVYMTDSTLLDSFSCTKYSLVLKESLPDLSSLKSISVAETGFEMFYTEDSEDYTWYAVIDGEDTALDSDSAETLAGYYKYFTWGDCVCYTADTDTLKEYGFDKPDATVTLGYLDSDGNEAVLTLKISLVDGIYYVQLPDSNMVYLLGEGIGDSTLSADALSMLPAEE